ncbi:MAG: ribonuclease R [Clostridia bacterium]|nr:ribonuclease R [Clostridia bacterium]
MKKDRYSKGQKSRHAAPKGTKPRQEGAGSAKAKDGPTRYVRRIPLDSFGVSPGRKAEGGKRTSGRENCKLLQLTVRGLRHGLVTLEAQDGTEYVCGKDSARGTLWGDVVLAESIGRDRVSVVRVVSRAHEEIVGVLRVKHEVRFIIPLERRLPQGIAVFSGGEDAQDGDIVKTRVVRWEDEGGLAVRILERIGSFTQSTHALDALIVASRLRTSFPADALAQADACMPASLSDDPARLDLRELLTFTIDGRDAKDFDDAVSLERLENGCVRLGVHIADVGCYVPQGSALDREAFLRGTSVYFPGRVLPMLPEQLSNGVCSLRPDEDKFTLSALMDLDARGEVTDYRIERTITRSKARLVYDDVNALFAGDAHQKAAMGELEGTLLAMRALAQKIRARRAAMGAIDFDTEEPKFVLDEQGEPVEIILRERGEAELMIEDFMLTANETVARLAKAKGLAILYRVHERPDPEKLMTLKDFLSGLGVDARSLKNNAKPGDIRAMLERTRETPEFGVISTLALRSMQKARYDAQPLGHYGLAMADYCHFTSPIRRYPDLVVSRALSALIRGERAPLRGDALEEAAVRSSDCERTAAEAERAADKLMAARMMRAHVGEVFDGTVSGVGEWGVFVRLENGAEGFMHVRTLDDWFDFDERRLTLRGERTGYVFSLGQPLCVRVEDVDLTQSTIELSMIESLRPRRKEKSERKKERERMREFTK